MTPMIGQYLKPLQAIDSTDWSVFETALVALSTDWRVFMVVTNFDLERNAMGLNVLTPLQVRSNVCQKPRPCLSEIANLMSLAIGIKLLENL